MRPQARKVVATGLGLVTPLGLSLEENWQKALAGASGITHVALPATERSPVQAVGAVTDENWNRLKAAFPEEASREAERRTLFSLGAAGAALDDAGLLRNAEACARCGVVWAAGLGIVRLEDLHTWTGTDGRFDPVAFGRQRNAVQGDSLLRHASDRAAAAIASRFGLGGLNATVTSACAAATQALGLAFRAVRMGETDLIVAGGADSMIHPVGLVYFVLLQAAATGESNPQSACRPFDRKRAGLVMGEGAGAVVLEDETHALRRGARIYGEVAGYGSSLDAYQVTAPHPQGQGAAAAMRTALRDARLTPGDIDYINAHGTGTKLNDAAETLAIKEVFKDRAYHIPISSSKSLIGHLMAAAGGPEFIYTALSVQRDAIHPTINLTNPDPKCDLDYVPGARRLTAVRAALSNSFGFGGQNAAIVVRKYERTAG
jgi:3-oxoacyl-[acyl-carrier-protein] synthase II